MPGARLLFNTPGAISASGAGALSLAGQAPAFARVQVPGQGALALTGQVPTIAASGGGGSTFWRQNQPGNHATAIQGLNFSDSIPNPGGTGEYVIGSSEWTIIGAGNSWLKQSDAGAGQSPPDIWRVVYPEAGSYSDGQNRGSVGRPLSNLDEVYVCIRFKLSANFLKHPISTKFLRIQISGGTYLLQISHDNVWFRVSTEEGPGYNYDGSITDGSAPSLGEWHTLEWFSRRGNGTGIVRTHLDGNIRTNATNAIVSPSGPFTTLSIDANYGGGGSDVPANQYLYVDDVYLSTV